MLPANKQMVLNVEFKLTPVPVPTVSGLETVLVGFLDYTIIVTDPQTAGRLCSPLFITESIPEQLQYTSWADLTSAPLWEISTHFWVALLLRQRIRVSHLVIAPPRL